MFKDDALKEVLIVAFLDPFKIQSDFARSRSQEVACLASQGFISTQEAPGMYGRKWRITGIGLEKLRDLEAL